MTLDQLNEYTSAEFGGPAIGGWPTAPGERIKPHKGGGGSSTTVQSIPAELKPLASAYSQKAIALSNQRYQPYYGDRFADLNSTQNAGIRMMQQRAQGGDPTVQAGAANIQRQLNSAPTEAAVNPYAQQGNPYLDAMVGKAQESVMRSANQMAAGSGSFGNSGIAEQAAEQFGDVATSMYGNAWGQQAQLAEAGAGRSDAMRQSWASNNLNAAGLGLQYGDQAYRDADQMLQAGQIQQDQAQQDKDFNYQQFTERQDLPYKQLAAMSGVFSSFPGGSTVTKQKGGGK